MVNTELFSDAVRREKAKCEEQFSPYLDLRLVTSTVTPDVTFAILVHKPKSPAPVKLGTHGWHMSISDFAPEETPSSDYLTVDVDMRGRAFSTGSPDCNGWELYDVYDAYRFVLKEYAAHIAKNSPVYFESGSGGGGNALAIAGKFPDLFSAVIALCPISDYEAWYRFDEMGEFRDEMDVWIGKSPDEDEEAYRARSGLTLLPNLMTHLLICHGNTDLRVPYPPVRHYARRAKEMGKDVSLLTLHGVGTRDHFGRATERQMALMNAKCKRNLKEHTEIPRLPERGELLVAGFLVTRHFQVFTDLDRVVKIRYDLAARTVTPIDTHAPIRVEWTDNK